VVADQFAGGSSPVVGGGSSVAGGDGSSAAGRAGSSVVGGGTSAAGGGVVAGSSAAGDGASAGDDASVAGGGGGGGVSPVLIALGADGSRSVCCDDPFAVGEDSLGVVSWAELPFCSLSTVLDCWLFSSRFGFCCSPSLSSLEVVKLRAAGALGRLVSTLFFSS
jgi:hypothetical protein